MPDTGVSGGDDPAALSLDPDRPTIEFEGLWHNWGDLRRYADELHAQLRASGVSDIAPVALVPRNRPSSIAALLALLTGERTIRMNHAFQSAEAIARKIVRLSPRTGIFVLPRLAMHR